MKEALTIISILVQVVLIYQSIRIHRLVTIAKKRIKENDEQHKELLIFALKLIHNIHVEKEDYETAQKEQQ